MVLKLEKITDLFIIIENICNNIVIIKNNILGVVNICNWIFINYYNIWILNIA